MVDGTETVLLNSLLPVHKQKFPVLGKIACGKPIMGTEHLEGYVYGDSHADFCLIAQKEHSDLAIAGVDMKAVRSFLNNLSVSDFDALSMRDLFQSLVNKIIVSPQSLELDLNFKVNNSVVALTRLVWNYLDMAIPIVIKVTK